jgi:fatty acid desaturase
MNNRKPNISKRIVEWHDLLHLTQRQKTVELTLSLPWLVASVVFYQIGWISLGLVCSFFFFLAGLRQAHGAQHYVLGVSRRIQDGLMFILSLLMLGSIHALQATHMHHHRHCLDETDVESATAGLPWWKAILVGPWFIASLHWQGYRLSKLHKRRWIKVELAAIAVWLGVVLVLPLPGLHWFVAAMFIGECLTGFFAVWTVHHDLDQEVIARTQRGKWRNRLTYGMFYHLEHHLFPAIPTPNLPELARRLDEARPGLSGKQVFPEPGFSGN